MPLISIITTTYKHEKFIRETIDSVLSQSFTDWELLIGDDSPDNATWDIIESYVEKYPNKIRAWHHSPNKGIVDNMNFLIKQINGDSQFVAFLEGDDYYTNDNLEKRIKAFEQNPLVQLVYSRFECIDETGAVISKDANSDPIVPNFCVQDKYHRILVPFTIFSYSSSMIRRALLEKVAIRNPSKDPLFSVSDWDFYFQVITQHPILFLPETLLHYRIHSGNLSRQTPRIGIDFTILLKWYFSEGIIDRKMLLKKALFDYSIKIPTMFRIRTCVYIFLPFWCIQKLHTFVFLLRKYVSKNSHHNNYL